MISSEFRILPSNLEPKIMSQSALIGMDFKFLVPKIKYISVLNIHMCQRIVNLKEIQKNDLELCK